MLSGFTIVRNAVKLDYPVVPAIRSILSICDEVIVNVGRSEDGTRELIAGIGDSRIRIIDGVWDVSQGSVVLAKETNRAMRACRGTWGVYIQADEVLHETGAAILKERMQDWDADQRVEGLLVDYFHFYGDFDTLATNRHFYRREVRGVRLDRDIRSFQDAQGFRVGPERRRVQARLTGARMFHYGWARAPTSLQRKLAATKELFPQAVARVQWQERRGGLEWTPLLRRFMGNHPRPAVEWIAARRCVPGDPVVPRRLTLHDLRYYLSDWIERLTGARVFEYRNYVQI
ncbi:MAG: glycosyltransferase family 2 protein [Gemmatimonadales bacterium]